MGNEMSYAESEIDMEQMTIHTVNYVPDYSKYKKECEKTGYYFPDSDSAYLQEEFVRKIFDDAWLVYNDWNRVASDIRLAINEIYARKQYDFTGSDYEGEF